jgi:hypothetical protein
VRVGSEHADAIWSDQPQPLTARRLFASLAERTRPVAKPGRDDDRRAHAHLGALGDHVRHGLRRRGDDHQIGGCRELGEVSQGRDTVNFAMLWIDQMQRA